MRVAVMSLCALIGGPVVPQDLESGKISPMSAMRRHKVRSALALAVRRLEKRETCRALFEPLGADGVTSLRTAEMHVATSRREEQICRERRAVAFTTVGGRDTYLCPRFFERLGRHREAATLIHEALHHAGLGEWPGQPDGPTPAEIDQMVFQSCNL